MYFLYLKLLLPCVIAAGARDRSLRVIGGRDVRADEYPYVVRLELKDATKGNIHMCTASVLTPTASLTAAICCLPIANWTLVIRYGSAPGRPTEDDRFSDVLSCLQHPAMPPFLPLYNNGFLFKMRVVSLAVLATQPIHVSGYARLSAVDSSALYGQRVQALGYGVTEHNGELGDTLSLKLPLKVLDAMWSRCDVYPTRMYPMVCLKRTCGDPGSLCKGDLGGPVVHVSGVVGIVFTVSQTGCVKNGDLFSDVELIAPLSTHVDWITDRLADTTFF